jgi:hypothetical protein
MTTNGSVHASRRPHYPINLNVPSPFYAQTWLREKHNATSKVSRAVFVKYLKFQSRPSVFNLVTISFRFW